MATKEAGSAQRLRAAGPVRITLPAKVAYDPKALKEGIRHVVERLGCPSCFSGANCLFQVERDFVMQSERVIGPNPHPWHGVASTEPEPMFAHRATVGLARSVRYDIDKVLAAVDKVIDVIGPHPCISGFDVLFRDEMIVINEKLEAIHL